MTEPCPIAANLLYADHAQNDVVQVPCVRHIRAYLPQAHEVVPAKATGER